MIRNNPKRFLAVDVRPRRFGFALFERPSRLLDCGVARFQSAGRAAIRIGSFIAAFHPELLILRKFAEHSRRNTAGARRVMKAVGRQARRVAVRVVFVSERRVRNTFQQKRKITKRQIAASLASMFPELGWKLPPQRKPWQSEHPRMAMFDAVSLAVAYATTHQTGQSTECH